MNERQEQAQQRLDEFKAKFSTDERRGLEGSDYAHIAVGDRFSRNQLQKALDGLRRNLNNPSYVRYASRGSVEHDQARVKALELVLERASFQ